MKHDKIKKIMNFAKVSGCILINDNIVHQLNAIDNYLLTVYVHVAGTWLLYNELCLSVDNSLQFLGIPRYKISGNISTLLHFDLF